MSTQTAHFGALPVQQYAHFDKPYSAQGYGSIPHGFAGRKKAALPAELTGWFSGLQLRKPFQASQRRRLNFLPLLGCLLVPWALFVLDLWVTSFSIRYDFPYVYVFVMACSALSVLAVYGTAVARKLKLFAHSQRDPSWLIFLTASMFVAVVLGYVVGNHNFSNYTRPYYDFHNLNIYTGIDPDRMRGQQLMDAGAIQFVEGTHLDISRSMGFKQGSMYCVAPITLGAGNETVQTYDFWAVGTGCCSGNQADFHCAGWGSPHSGGLRLLGGPRDQYRLAVQQAEATYGIKAAHPLFFDWVPRPLKLMENWQTTARTSFVIWIFAHLLVQAFLVISAALAFTKLGQV